MTDFLHKYDQLYQENKNFIESSDCTRYPEILFNEMLPHLLLSWDKPSAAHRAEITNLKVSKYPNLKINERQKEMILALSDDLQLDELECFELALDLSSPGVKAELEQQLDVEPLDFTVALRELFFFRKKRVVMILFDLMKARSCEEEEDAPPLRRKKKDVVMGLTNQLFREGLGSRVMELITEQLSLLLDQTRAKTRSRSFSEKMIQYLQHLGECLFYMFYRTQISRPEADELLELIRVLSNALIPTLAEKMPQGAAGASGAGDGATGAVAMPVEDLLADSALFPTLVILQLTHVRALNQVAAFYSRDDDEAPYGCGQLGNALLSEEDTEWDYGQELLSSQASTQWENRMARGFTCLSLGVVRQPYVEALTMHTSETEAFFFKAAECNAYSYLRLCVVPTIQCYDDLSSVDSSDFRDLLMSTLTGDSHSGLVVDLMNSFVDECYRKEFPFNTHGRQRDLELRREQLDVAVYEATNEPAERVIFTDNPDDNPPFSCDCVDDILDMLTVTLIAQPAFAQKLWRSNGTKHSFVTALLEMVDREAHELKFPAMRFLTAVANSQQPNFAFNVYSLISGAKATYTELFDWKDYFKILENSTNDLRLLAGGGGGGGGQHPLQLQQRGQLQAFSAHTPPPCPPDEYFLEDAVNLLGSVMRDPRVTREFISQQFDPVRVLFNLLVCQVGVTLKGAILRALAALCSSLAPTGHVEGGGETAAAAEVSRLEVVEQVWLYLEQYQLLPCTSLGSGRNGVNRNYGGLHYELEHVESAALGQYPATLGFLTLLVALLDQRGERGGGGVPHNLGYGERIPGVVNYLDYVIGEVLLKLETRRYLPANFSGEGQKWKVATLSVRVLTVIMQQYNINSLTADDVQNCNPASHRQQVASSIFQTPSEEVTSMALDFHDVTVSYPLVVTEAAPRQFPAQQQQQQQQQQQLQQYSLTTIQAKRVQRDEMRPKTVGFAVMSSLLDQKRGLLLFLIQILQENSPKNISYIRQQEVLHLASLSVQDCIANSERNMCLLREEISAKFREIELPQSYQQQYQHQRQNQRQVNQQILQQQQHDQPHVAMFFEDVEHSTEVGWDDMFYDNAHWRLQAAAAVVGLLHEVALREVAFLARVRAAGPLCMPRASGGGAQSRSAASVLVEVQVVALSTSLVTDLQSYQLLRHHRQGRGEVESQLPLSCVLAYLSFLPEKKTLLCTPSLEIMALRILKHVALNQTSKKVLHSLKDMGVDAQKMIENCNFFIENCNYLTEDQPSDGCRVMRHSGSVGEVVDVQRFTQSVVDSVRPALEDSESEYQYSSKREAVLDLLLTTLRPADECLCHYLLFGLDGISGGLSSGQGPNINCLEAVLDLITVVGGGGGGDIFIDDAYVAVTHPFQALQCFELVYRLHASPLTSGAVRRLVARRSSEKCTGHLMINYLRFYLEHSRKQRQMRRQGGGDGERYSLEDAARLNCCAWALKVVALELTLHSHLNENENIGQILQVLFQQSSEYAEASGATTSDTTSSLLFQLLQLLPLSLDFDFGFSSRDASEAVIIQCMRESSKPYVLSQGRPHQAAGRCRNYNEPPGDFLFVDIPHCILLLKTYFKYSSRTGGAAGGGSGVAAGPGAGAGAGAAPRRTAGDDAEDEARITGAVQVGMEYNSYISTMAAMANFCHAFRQIVEAALFKHTTVLLGDFRLVTYEDPRDQAMEGADHEHKVLQTAEQAINQLVAYCIQPCLGLLAHSPAMEMVHAEQLAKALLAMFDTLRSITLEAQAAQDKCATGINAPPPLTAACYGDLLALLILAILRRGGVGSPRHPSSAVYRGQLYLSFFSLLQCGEDMASKGCIGYSVQEDIQQHCRDLLQSHVVELMDVMGDDIAQGVCQQGKRAPSSSQQTSTDDESLLTCASGAFSALAGVLAVLGPAASSAEAVERGGLVMAQHPQYAGTSNYSGTSTSTSKRFRDCLHISPGYLHGLRTLLDRGYFARVFASVGLTAATASAPEYGGNFKRQKSSSGTISGHNVDVNTMESVLSLCAHLACSTDGTRMLLDLGVFHAVNSLPLLPIPTHTPAAMGSSSQHSGQQLSEQLSRLEEQAEQPFCIDNLGILLNKKQGGAASAGAPQWLADDNIDAMLSLFLLLFRSALASSRFPDILDQAAAFLSRNYALVAHYLRLQSPTLAGLEVCHSIVSLFCMVASGPAVRTAADSTVLLPSWESRLGAKGDGLTSELSKLLTALGSSPLPADMCPIPPHGRQSQRASSWWTVVNPHTARELQLAETQVATPPCLRALASTRSLTSSVSQWSSFDHRKFQFGLDIIERSTSFFRIRCGQWTKLAGSSSSFGLQGEDEEAACLDALGLGALKFDFAVLSFTFQSLGSLYLQLSQEQRAHHGQAWLKSPFVFGGLEGDGAGAGAVDEEEQGQGQDQALREELLRAVESLLSAVLDISRASLAAARFGHGQELDVDDVLDELQQCVQVTDRFPPHSFVHQIGRTLVVNNQ